MCGDWLVLFSSLCSTCHSQALLVWSKHVAPHDVSFAKGLVETLMGELSSGGQVGPNTTRSRRSLDTQPQNIEEELYVQCHLSKSYLNYCQINLIPCAVFLFVCVCGLRGRINSTTIEKQFLGTSLAWKGKEVNWKKSVNCPRGLLALLLPLIKEFPTVSS